MCEKLNVYMSYVYAVNCEIIWMDIFLFFFFSKKSGQRENCKNRWLINGRSYWGRGIWNCLHFKI